MRKAIYGRYCVRTMNLRSLCKTARIDESIHISHRFDFCLTLIRDLFCRDILIKLIFDLH